MNARGEGILCPFAICTTMYRDRRIGAHVFLSMRQFFTRVPLNRIHMHMGINRNDRCV